MGETNYKEGAMVLIVILVLGIIALAVMSVSADATKRAQIEQNKVGDEHVVEFNGIEYIECTNNIDWGSVQCFMVIDGKEILCSPDGLYSTATNPLCFHIILNHELDRRGL